MKCKAGMLKYGKCEASECCKFNEPRCCGLCPDRDPYCCICGELDEDTSEEEVQ